MKNHEMTSYERVMAAFRRKDFDIYPAINPTSVATIDSMKMTGAFFPHAHTDRVKMAKLAAVGYEMLGFDTIMPYFSVHLESSALGCEINWGNEYQIPRVFRVPVKDIRDFGIPSTFLAKPEIQALLKTTKSLKKTYSGKAAIIGKVIGPWTLAYHLFGVENLILDTILEPERTKQLIEMLSEVPIAFAKAQFDAGADLLTWAEHVTNDLVSPQIYSDFVLPIHKRASFELAKYGSCILHICGNVMDRLWVIKQTGFAAFHIDSRNDILKALDIIDNQMLLVGGINNPVTLAQGARQDVQKEVRALMRKKIHLVAPECALPCNVSNENLITLTEEIHRSEVMK